MSKTYCPVCDAIISVNLPLNGAMLKCPECSQELEVISTDPFEVGFPLDEEDLGSEWEDEEEEE